MLGRDADWQASTAVLPARQMLDRVAAIGFDGLVYDTGSTYHGGAPSVDDISAVLGQKPRLGRATSSSRSGISATTSASCASASAPTASANCAAARSPTAASRD